MTHKLQKMHDLQTITIGPYWVFRYFDQYLIYAHYPDYLSRAAFSGDILTVAHYLSRAM